MELSAKLVQLGFSKNEATVYITLVELGQCKASDIIKKTGLHRNIVYEALDDLVLKKLAFKTSKGGVALFQLSDANTLIDTAQQQLAVAQEVSKQINTAREKSPHEIKLYEGFEGFKSHHESILNELQHDNTNELLVIASEQVTQQFFNTYFKKFNKKRADGGISTRLLGKDAAQIEMINREPFTKTKLLSDNFTDPVETKIWTDHVAFMLNDIEPLIISIKNKRLANSFREYFENLWKQDVQTYRGEKELRLLMEESLEHIENWFIGGNGGIMAVMPEYWEDYNRRRIEKGIWWHDLIDHNYVPLTGMSYSNSGVRNEKEYFEYKVLPNEMNSPTVIFMYGNKVAHILWDAEIAFVLENKEVFESYRTHFDYLWNQDTFITTGLASVQELFYAKMRELKQDDEYAVLWGSYGDDHTKTKLVPWFITYNTERIKKGIVLKGILFESIRKQMEDEIDQAGDPDRRLTPLRYVQEDYGSPMQVNIYPDSIVFFCWNNGEDAVAVEIRKQPIRDAMQAYFDGIWKTL